MPISQRTLRRSIAPLAGDYLQLTASGNGASDGTTILLAALNGRGEDEDVGKWVVTPSNTALSLTSLFSRVTIAAEGPPYTLTVTPGIGQQVMSGNTIELMAYSPQFYNAAIIEASGEVFPKLFQPFYNTEIDPIEEQDLYVYEIPDGVDPEWIKRIMMTGPENSPWVDQPVSEFLNWEILDGQIMFNYLAGGPFFQAPIVGRQIVLLGWKPLSGVTPALGYTLPLDADAVDPDDTVGPELVAGSVQLDAYKEQVLASLFRVIMRSPSTPDRAAFAQAAAAQQLYADQQTTKFQQRRPVRRPTM